ncbi:hypothetical protein QOT17_012902 [Balamuthia mandrillaris]
MPAEPPTCDVFVCSDCGLETDSKKQLHTHRNRRGPVFAKFVCPKCKNGWSSAHAYCKNFQQCKGCKTRTYPQQTKYKEKPEEETVQTDDEEAQPPLKPHQAHLCERCIKGLRCSAASILSRSSPKRGRSRSSPKQVRTTPSGGKARPQPYAKKQQAPLSTMLAGMSISRKKSGKGKKEVTLM